MEVTKDYAKQNKGNYYFMVSDLTEQERTFFDSCYTKLEYDYLYKMHNEPLQISKGKALKKL